MIIERSHSSLVGHIDDGTLANGDPALMSEMLQGQLKAVAFWPQVAMGQNLLSEVQQAEVIRLTVEMFLGVYGKAKS